MILLHCQDFIRKCLVLDPAKRPKARDLLFHPVLFEVTRDFSNLNISGPRLHVSPQVHSLKLLAAHTLVKNPGMEVIRKEQEDGTF